MKNKKLFAILTLVCFMFTLMPVAAFAVDTDMQVYVNGEAEANEVMAGDITISTTPSNVAYLVVEDTEEEEGVAVVYTAENENSATVNIEVAGDYKAYALALDDKGNIADFIDAVDSPANKVAALKAAYAKEIEKFDEATFTVVIPDMEYQIRFIDKVSGKYITSKEIPANNGFNAGKTNDIVAVLEKAAEEDPREDKWSGLKYQTLTLTTVGYVDAEFIDGAKTDKNGKVEFEITSGTAGEYKVIAKWGKTKATLSVNVVAGNATKVAVNNEPEAPVNIDGTVEDAGVEFKFTDASGAAAAFEDVEITLVEKPAASKLKSENFDLEADDKGKEGVWDLVADKDFDKEGTYKVKVALENGASATATVVVAEQGDIVAIKFVDAPSTIAYSATTEFELVNEDNIVTVDADGVTGAPTDEALKFSFVGKAVESFTADGKVALDGDDKYIGSKVVVYAVYEPVTGEVYTASTELVVTDDAAGVKYLSTNAEVGVTTDLYANVVDADGNKVELEGDVRVEYVVLDKPENAIAVVTGKYIAYDKHLVETSLLASVAGEYEIQTIVVTKDNKYISGVDTFTVGAGSTYNDIVVMSIGATKFVVNNEVKEIPTAPVIENSRTFVPLRALVEAFGAEVNWDDATRSVTVVLDNTTVVMTIGSAEYTVNGVAKTMDVAPFINADNYTMVPVRFVAQAFGITPTPIADEVTGAVVDVMFAK